MLTVAGVYLCTPAFLFEKHKGKPLRYLFVMSKERNE